MSIHLVLGNQLFPSIKPEGKVLMIEDLGLASRYRYHQLRILHQFIAMREYRDHLIAKKIPVDYFEIQDSLMLPMFERILSVMKRYETRELVVAEIPDVRFRQELLDWAVRQKVALRFIPSDQFMVSCEDFSKYLGKSKKPFMKTFYEKVRLDHQILVQKNQSPVGGRWSFDVENRKKLPKGLRVPSLLQFSPSIHQKPAMAQVKRIFPTHPGLLPASPEEGLWLPVNRKDSLKLLKDFLESRFRDFGPYEDAIDPQHDFLFHSGLSPLINLGLLSPAEVVDQAISYGQKNKVPMESIEGLVRQIIGWREFIRGIHENFEKEESTRNFFNHRRKMKPCWYEGTTGLPPVDDAIKKVQRLAYNHHIERLMVLSNAMLLTELDPHEVHQWFMEMYMDSYEWVMGPNVYGMAQFSDGGIFATKPYISGSNYLLKMSSYPKGEWCEIWDGLYWSFIGKHRDFFSKNPRLSMMSKMFEKMESRKKERLMNLAARFKDEVSLKPA